MPDQTTTHDLDTARRRVAVGAALLDKRSPDWVTEIDLDRLDMANEFDCVLGQLYGRFHNGCVVLALMREDIIGGGFDRYYHDDDDFPGFSALTVAWADAVEARR